MKLLAELTKNSSSKDKMSITVELPVGRLTDDDVLELHSFNPETSEVFTDIGEESVADVEENPTGGLIEPRHESPIFIDPFEDSYFVCESATTPGTWEVQTSSGKIILGGFDTLTIAAMALEDYAEDLNLERVTTNFSSEVHKTDIAEKPHQEPIAPLVVSKTATETVDGNNPSEIEPVAPARHTVFDMVRVGDMLELLPIVDGRPAVITEVVKKQRFGVQVKTKTGKLETLTATAVNDNHRIVLNSDSVSIGDMLIFSKAASKPGGNLAAVVGADSEKCYYDFDGARGVGRRWDFIDDVFDLYVRAAASESEVA